jgi:dephospho-CoA kinase
VICDTETAVARLLLRDTRSEKEIRARLLSQKDEKFFREHADILIENNGGREELLSAFSRAMEAIRAHQ